MKLSIFLVSALLVISCVAQDNDDYIQVPEDEIQSSEVINDILNYGIAFIFDRAADKFGVSNENPEITSVNSVYREDTDDDEVYYRCSVDATNNDDATVEATFTIEYDRNTEEKRVRRWRYNINYEINDSEAEGESNEEEDLEYGIDEYQEEEHYFEDHESDWTDDYDEVSDDEIQNSEVINGVLSSGIAFIFDKAAEKFGVSNENIEITQVNSVYREELEDITNYRCHVDATNNDDATVNARFTVEYDNASGEKTVRRWWYHIDYETNDEEVSLDNSSEDEGSQ